jgi:hypothetical protein
MRSPSVRYLFTRRVQLIHSLTRTDVLVIFPLSIPIPRRLSSSINRSLAALRITDIDTSTSDDSPAPKERSYLVLGTTFSPVLGVLILLASQSIDAATARKGVVGSEDGVKPYDISEMISCSPFKGLTRSFRL